MAFVFSVGLRRVKADTSLQSKHFLGLVEVRPKALQKHLFILSYSLINVLDDFTLLSRNIYPSYCLIFCGFCYGKLRFFYVLAMATC